MSDEQLTLLESLLQQLATAGAAVTVIELPPSLYAAWSIAQTLCDSEGAAVNGKRAVDLWVKASPAAPWDWRITQKPPL